MHQGPYHRDSVRRTRERLFDERGKLQQQHADGSPGIQVCARLADLLDSIVLELYEATLADLGEAEAARLSSQIAMVSHGGYGRQDVAPFSDVDLMLLHDPRAAQRVVPLARRLVTDLCDVGLNLGFSVRTPKHACSLMRSDATVFTSLVESRLLAGSNKLFAKFEARFRREMRRRTRSLIQAIRKARRDERHQYGETVYLLEPNIKRSRGGLRDLQLLRWVGFARYGDADPDNLHLSGVLRKQDQTRLREASEFLLRLRNEMHFHAGRSQDVLQKSEQLRLAELYGFQGETGVLPVEQFMREYFRQTVRVRNTVARFVSSALPRSILTTAFSPLLAHRVENDFRVGLRHIRATRKSLPSIQGDPAQVLRLMDLANLYNARIDPETWNAIRQTMSDREQIEMTDEATGRFLSLLSQPTRLGSLLRRLHELGVLEKLVPGMSRARCLLQFNEYHKFTVDEHCIQAVQRATDFTDHPGPLGEAYCSMKRKRTLHLALLLHDMGKGYAEDHCEVGRRLAIEAAERFQLPERETEKLVFLVHKHLMMSHLAFRRDTSDESVVVQFAVDVGTPDLLKMLYVLTCADLAAVGPGVLNHWKVEVLTELYLRTMQHLAGDGPAGDPQQRYQQQRERVRAALPGSEQDSWYADQIAALPPAYLRGTDHRHIATQLSNLRTLDRQRALAWVRYLPDHEAVEYTVGAYEEITPGIFHKLTGALTSQRLQILSADIYTLVDDLVLDRFHVHDPDYTGRPPQERLESIVDRLVWSLSDSNAGDPSFRATWDVDQRAQVADLSPLPTRVLVDNNSSDRHTIIDIFAHDRIGLLYTITRTLFELSISVSTAKIGTYVDQVVDVFYVTDQRGNKIEDDEEIRHIKSRLLESIEPSQPSSSVRT